MKKIQIEQGTIHTVPEDVELKLVDNPNICEIWNSLTPLARNEWICYVTIVKKIETRESHIERLCADLLKGKKRPCCWPGCPHHRPSAGKWHHSTKSI